jgi:hypothetical protein
MSYDPIQTAQDAIDGVRGAERAILFVNPWCRAEDGMSSESTICSPSELSVGEDPLGDVIMVGSEAKARLTCFVNQTDQYLILPLVRLTDDALDAALSSIRTTLDAIAAENKGRCGYSWNIFDNREVPCDQIVVGGQIVLPEATFPASDLMHVSTFLMAGDPELEESSVEMFFADGRVARLRGGMDWYNAMC